MCRNVSNFRFQIPLAVSEPENVFATGLNISSPSIIVEKNSAEKAESSPTIEDAIPSPTVGSSY
jgi:hypothetical protein